MARRKYLESRSRDLTQYMGMIGEEFRSKIDQLSKILGDIHELSVGEYKESILRNFIRNFIPKRFSVGTGFVVFPGKSAWTEYVGDNADLLNMTDYVTSQQIDIIVFDDFDYAPIFREQDFVVVRPESVRAVIEVKGFLKRAHVKSSLASFVKFGRAWVFYEKYYRNYIMEKPKLAKPALFLMAWNVYVDKSKGKPQCDGGLLRKEIVKTYREHLTPLELDPNTFPLLSAAYIYDDCVVDLTGISGIEGWKFAYSTRLGKFVRYGEDKKAVVDRDCTIASLLAMIYVHLGVPFNPDFAHYNQSTTNSVHPHKFAGMTNLATGKEYKG